MVRYIEHLAIHIQQTNPGKCKTSDKSNPCWAMNRSGTKGVSKRVMTRFCSLRGARRGQRVPLSPSLRAPTSPKHPSYKSLSWSIGYCHNSHQRPWSHWCRDCWGTREARGHWSERGRSPPLPLVLCPQHAAHSQVQSSLCLHRALRENGTLIPAGFRWSTWMGFMLTQWTSVPWRSLWSHLHEAGREGTMFWVTVTAETM